jgi:hypothetical protein
MKNILILCFTIFYITAHTQVKNDNLIILTTEANAEKNYKTLLTKALDNHFDIKKKHDNLQAIQLYAITQNKNMVIELHIQARCKDNQIVLKGHYINTGTKSEIRKKGMKGSPALIAWEKLSSFANTIPSTKIEYTKK